MPFYEYRCESCQERFEELVRGDEEVRCPGCAAREVTRLPSTFAMGRAAPSRALAPARAPGPGGCGSCGDPRGPGACKL